MFIKKCIVLLLVVFYSVHGTVCVGQTPIKLVEQKDINGNTFNYIGETANGKANGNGLATYNSGDKLFGLFENGQANGHCIFLFFDGRALIGNFKNGKAEGEIVLMRKDGSMYIGGFENDSYNGFAKVLTQQNLYTAGWYQNGYRNGRGLEIGADGFIFDGIYINDKRNGAGLQYQPAQKAFYEGIWKDDKWTGPSTTTLQSFLKAPNFKGFSEPGKIVAAKVDSVKKLLNDTCLLFRPKTNERFFGKFKDGIMQNGFHATGDSIKYWGDWGPKGGEGKGVYGKKGQYLGVGTFKDGKLNGEATYVNIYKKTIYDGGLKDGMFAGKGTFINASNTIITGNFGNGKLEGQGTILYASGVEQAGIFNHGILTEPKLITKPDGQQIDCQPKTLYEAINILVNEHSEHFNAFKGEPNKDTFALLESDSIYYSFNAAYSFPLGDPASIIETKLGSFFKVEMLGAADAKANYMFYKNICQQIGDMRINIKTTEATYKLKDKETTREMLGGRIVCTTFSLPEKLDNHAAISVLFVNEDVHSKLYIIVGERLKF